MSYGQQNKQQSDVEDHTDISDIDQFQYKLLQGENLKLRRIIMDY